MVCRGSTWTARDQRSPRRLPWRLRPGFPSRVSGPSPDPGALDPRIFMKRTSAEQDRVWGHAWFEGWRRGYIHLAPQRAAVQDGFDRDWKRLCVHTDCVSGKALFSAPSRSRLLQNGQGVCDAASAPHLSVPTPEPPSSPRAQGRRGGAGAAAGPASVLGRGALRTWSEGPGRTHPRVIPQL